MHHTSQLFYSQRNLALRLIEFIDTFAFSTGCGNRFTHANRHCPNHPFSRLKREEPKEGLGKAQSVDNKAVAEWLAK